MQEVENMSDVVNGVVFVLMLSYILLILILSVYWIWDMHRTLKKWERWKIARGGGHDDKD